MNVFSNPFLDVFSFEVPLTLLSYNAFIKEVVLAYSIFNLLCKNGIKVEKLQGPKLCRKRALYVDDFYTLI